MVCIVGRIKDVMIEHVARVNGGDLKVVLLFVDIRSGEDCVRVRKSQVGLGFLVDGHVLDERAKLLMGGRGLKLVVSEVKRGCELQWDEAVGEFRIVLSGKRAQLIYVNLDRVLLNSCLLAQRRCATKRRNRAR